MIIISMSFSLGAAHDHKHIDYVMTMDSKSYVFSADSANSFKKYILHLMR